MGSDQQISFEIEGWRVNCRKPYDDILQRWSATASNDFESRSASAFDPGTALRNLADKIDVEPSEMLARAGI